MFDGEVVAAVNDKGNKEYGGLVIIKHNINNLEFYTLYGHNTVESVLKNTIGKKINNSLKGLKYSLMIKISLFDFRIIKNKTIDKNIKNDGIIVIISNTFKKLTIKILEKTIFSPKLPSREKI